MAKKLVPMHLTQAQLEQKARASSPPRKVLGVPLSFNHAASAVSDTLSNVAAQEQAASAAPSLDVPQEIFHMGDGSAKQADDTADLHDAATRANAGIQGMSVGEKVGIVAAVGLAATGLYKWITKR